MINHYNYRLEGPVDAHEAKEAVPVANYNTQDITREKEVDLKEALGAMNKSLGESWLLALENISYSFKSKHWDQGQAHEGYLKAPRFYGLTTGKLTYDFKDSSLLDFVPRPIYPLQWKYKSTETIYQGQRGWRVGREQIEGSKKGPLSSARIAFRLKILKMSSPDLLLRSIVPELQNPTAYVASQGDQRWTVIEGLWKEARFRMYYSSHDHVISHADVLEDLPIQGDVLYRVDFLDWKPVSSGHLPARVVHTYDGNLVQDEYRSDFIVDARIDFSIDGQQTSRDEADFRLGHHRARFYVDFINKNFPKDDPPSVPSFEQRMLTDKILFIKGPLYNTLAIDQGENMVMLEAPFTPEWTEAALKLTERQFPGKPVSHVVLSHQHYDHISGVRACIARQMTIVVPDHITQAFTNFAEGVKTIVPDMLETGAKPNVVGVADKHVIKGENGVDVEVYAIENNHCHKLNLTYIPREKLVFITDLFSPGIPPMTGVIGFIAPRAMKLQTPVTMQVLGTDALNFVTAVDRINLEVETIVGGHGDIATMNEARKLAAFAPTFIK